MATEVNFENLSEKLHEMRNFVLEHYIRVDMEGDVEGKQQLRGYMTILKDLADEFGIPGILF